MLCPWPFLSKWSWSWLAYFGAFCEQPTAHELRNFGLFSRPASSAPCATVWTEFPDFACPTRARRRGDRIARCPFMAESGPGAFLLLCPLSGQSGHRSSCGLTASVEFDPKRTWTGPRSRSAATSWRIVVLSFGGSARGVASALPRFRTIQVCPNDLPAPLRQVERAVD